MLFAARVVAGRGYNALYSITIFFPTMYLHNIVPMRAAHAAKFSRQQPFKIHDERTRKMCPKIGRNVLHINMMFWAPFSRKWSSMGPFSAFSHTQQIVWRVESRLQVATTLPLTYVRRVGDYLIVPRTMGTRGIEFVPSSWIWIFGFFPLHQSLRY